MPHCQLPVIVPSPLWASVSPELGSCCSNLSAHITCVPVARCLLGAGRESQASAHTGGRPWVCLRALPCTLRSFLPDGSQSLMFSPVCLYQESGHSAPIVKDKFYQWKK